MILVVKWRGFKNFVGYITAIVWAFSFLCFAEKFLGKDSEEYEIINSSPYFDKGYYLKNNTDVLAAGMDPIEHYLNYGWLEVDNPNRNPSKEFDNFEYIYHYPNVAVQRVPPLLHYETVGKRRGCRAFPVKEGARGKCVAGISKLADKYLSGRRGIEIGASFHNSFFLQTINVDYTDSTNVFKSNDFSFTKHPPVKVDIVASGDDLPFKDNSVDFVLNSHCLEHFFDPIKAINEWIRVIKPGGILFMIIPHKMRIFDKDRPRTKLKELIDRHEEKIKIEDSKECLGGHYNVWITEDVLELCKYLDLEVIEYQDVDDKVGNGFTVVIRKIAISEKKGVMDE